MKERILTLEKRVDPCGKLEYVLRYKNGGYLKYFCPREFNLLCPALKLRKGQSTKLKLTQLKNGIKLEKVK